MDEISNAVLNEVRRVIVGKDEVLQKVFLAILAGGHILLEDVPGVGKTQLALAFSRAMGLEFGRVQFTPDTLASDITGFTVYNRDRGTFSFRKGAIFCNFFLGDEINRTSSKTQAALLQAMEEQSVTVDGRTHSLPEPFICVATQNPLGSAGTHRLPDSQLDRFMVCLSLGYPSVEETVQLVEARQTSQPLDMVREVLSAEDLRDIRNRVREIFVDRELVRYVAELCEETRKQPEFSHGVSPRAALALVQMAKASAFVDGRTFAVPRDFQALFPDVCIHRVALTPQARANGKTAKELLETVLNTVMAPSLADPSK